MPGGAAHGLPSPIRAPLALGHEPVHQVDCRAGQEIDSSVLREHQPQAQQDDHDPTGVCASHRERGQDHDSGPPEPEDESGQGCDEGRSKQIRIASGRIRGLAQKPTCSLE